MRNWWVTDTLEQGPIFLFSWVVWVIGSIVLHELAHGWAAIRCGDRTPIETGHMTWNPVVHMGVPSLVMFALVGIAWGMMPVNSRRLRGRYGEARVALAGPMMNVWLGVGAAVGAALIARYGAVMGEQASENLFMFLMLGAMLNFTLAMFNLVPVPPLDGSRIVANLWPRYAEAMRSERAAGVSMVVFIVLLVWGGSYFFAAGMRVTSEAVAAIGTLLP